MNQGKLHSLKVGNPPDQEPPNIRGVDISGGSGSGEGTMGERLARLEGAFEGLKSSIEGLRHSQNVLALTVTAGFSILIAVVLYAVARIDNLPADFERMNQTLSTAITATKQQAPQVIVLPQSAIQPPAPTLPQPTLPKK